jgi:hypothetical protein
VWKLPSHFFTAFLHSGRRNAAAALGPRRAGSALHRTVVSTPSFFDSGHPRTRREILNLFPHFPLAAGDHSRRNLIAAVAVPRFKPAGDPIADILFFLGSSLQNISAPLQFKSTDLKICRNLSKNLKIVKPVLLYSRSPVQQLLLLKFSLKLNALSAILNFNKRESCMYLLHASFIS